MRKLLTFCGCGEADHEGQPDDFNWLSTASMMIQNGETVRTPSRERVTLLVKWARIQQVQLALTNPASTGASYTIVRK